MIYLAEEGDVLINRGVYPFIEYPDIPPESSYKFVESTLDLKVGEAITEFRISTGRHRKLLEHIDELYTLCPTNNMYGLFMYDYPKWGTDDFEAISHLLAIRKGHSNLDSVYIVIGNGNLKDINKLCELKEKGLNIKLDKYIESKVDERVLKDFLSTNKLSTEAKNMIEGVYCEKKNL